MNYLYFLKLFVHRKFMEEFLTALKMSKYNNIFFNMVFMKVINVCRSDGKG